MEVAECILLLLYLNQSATPSFLKPILLVFPSTCSLHFIIGALCLHFLSTPCTKLYHCLQNIFLRLSQNITIPLFALARLSAASFNQLPLYSSCPPTSHRPCHRSFCSSQSSYFVFSQKSCFVSI